MVPTLVVATAKAFALTAILWAVFIAGLLYTLAQWSPMLAAGLKAMAGFVWRNPRCGTTRCRVI